MKITNSFLILLLSVLSSTSCYATTLEAWILNPTEYAAASSIIQMNGNPCDIAFALKISSSTTKCTGDAKQYGAQILKEFRLAQSIAGSPDFTTLDYEAVWASNYPADHSEPGYTYAACAISFEETYPGDLSYPNLLKPDNLVCNQSMIIYGKRMIDSFEKITKVEMKKP